ncbi:hypothetical protein ACWIID_09325 [Streptomyces phaeochromogenes]
MPPGVGGVLPDGGGVPSSDGPGSELFPDDGVPDDSGGCSLSIGAPETPPAELARALAYGRAVGLALAGGPLVAEGLPGPGVGVEVAVRVMVEVTVGAEDGGLCPESDRRSMTINRATVATTSVAAVALAISWPRCVRQA